MLKKVKTILFILLIVLAIVLIFVYKSKVKNSEEITPDATFSSATPENTSAKSETGPTNSIESTEKINSTEIQNTETPQITATPTPTPTVKVTATPTTTTAPAKTTSPAIKTATPVVNQTEKMPKSLCISEVISSNDSSYMAYDDEYYDIVELYNNSNETIYLNEYYCSDKQKKLMMWQLPDVDLEPGEYYVFYATGNESDEASFAPFALSSEGDNIYLTYKDGTVVDYIDIPEIPTNLSYGRLSDKLVYFLKPTIGKINGGDYKLGICEDVTADTSYGNFDSAKTIKLSCEGATIYYTTDGTLPTVNSKKYDGNGIKITENTVIRAISHKDNYIDSEAVAFSYFVGEPELSLDIVSISVNNSDFDNMCDDYDSHSNICECNVSLISGGNVKFSVNCGIKLQGDSTRVIPKKSFQLKFKSCYGPSKLKYKVFDNLDVDEFNCLVLRSGAGAQACYKAYYNDEFWTSFITQKDSCITEVYSQAYKPVNLYINGEYWGVYFLREKIDEDFVASRLNVSPEFVSIVEAVDDEMKTDWYPIWQKISADSFDATDPDNYAYIEKNFNLESVADYYIMQAFTGNYDSSNCRLCKSTEADNKWHYIFFDLDYAFTISYEVGKQNPATLMLSKNVNYLTDGPACFNSIFYKLMKTEAFQKIFYARLEKISTELCSAELLLDRWNSIYNTIKGDMQYSIKRWSGTTWKFKHDVVSERAYANFDEWQEQVDYVRTKWLCEAHVNRIVSGFNEYKFID